VAPGVQFDIDKTLGGTTADLSRQWSMDALAGGGFTIGRYWLEGRYGWDLTTFTKEQGNSRRIRTVSLIAGLGFR
jgi:hypothetical protein